MKRIHRVLGVLLCLCLFSYGAVSIFAQNGAENTVVTICDECGQTGGHLETCSLYEAPVEEILENVNLQVGDKIWIKSGSKLYKSIGAEVGYTTKLSYHVEIKAIENIGGVVWYQFEYQGFSAIVGSLLLEDYKWVRAENTSVEEPDDGNACNCGENAPDNIADHADSCPRKAYIKTLFDGKTAEEIYAQWETYDEATQTDLLNMLQIWDNAKYEELKEKVENGSPTDGEFPVIAVDGVSIGIATEDGVFPEGTTVSIENVENAASQIASSKSVLAEYFSEYTVNIFSSKVVDITFVCSDEEVQPNGSVYVTFEIPVEEIISSADNLAIFHISEDGAAELMAIQMLDNSGTASVTVEATHFSHYVVLQSETEYKPTLMRDKLNGNSRYSIVEFPVTLNDFDAALYNNTYGSSGLWFTTGASGTGMNLGALPATQGIVAENLSVAGYPVTNGMDRGSIIFSGDSATGKTVHSNVPFEFIYDNQTGYYTYNSGANHAQYNSTTNKVELYADTLAPFNYRTDLLSKITANSDNATKVTSNSNVKITVNKPTSNNMFRIADANFADVDTDEYTHMYLRLKATFGGQIKCRVFYSDSDYDTYSLDLQEDKWADYVFGPFDTGKTAKYVRFYIQDAAKNDYVEIDTAGVLWTDNDTEVNFAGFYPFNTTLTTSYSGSEKFDSVTWGKLIQSGNNHQLYSSRVMFNTPFTSNSLNDTYVYFSMAMDVDFYIPADGKVNGQDIVFNFNGDDDMWVFVDGKLALDIGGAHTDVAGSINFTTGATYVENVRSLTDTTLTGNGAKNGQLSSEQYTAGEYHKLKIFYMERAGTNSNCLIKFNLPVVPTGDVMVEKKVIEENGNTITEDMTFTFQATVASSAYSNQNYTRITKDNSGNIVKMETDTTDSQGKFTLKHNQTATFSGIDEGTDVTIIEMTPISTARCVYKSTAVNGNTGYTASGTTSANSIVSFQYVNTYAAMTDIVIEKNVTGLDINAKLPENQTFFFRVKGNDENTQHIDLTVAINIIISKDDLKDGTLKDSVTIKNVPVGSYTVTEDTNWGWRYMATSDTVVTKSVTSVADNTFSFTNNRRNPFWLSGDCYCENWWGGDNGTVVKRPLMTTIIE